MIEILGNLLWWIAFAAAHLYVANFWCCCEDTTPGPDCTGICNLGTAPGQIKLVVAGIVNPDLCPSGNWDALNGTFFLPPNGACEWVILVVGMTDCTTGEPFTEEVHWRAKLFTFIGGPHLIVDTVFGDAGVQSRWEHTFGTIPFDCRTISDLTPDTGPFQLIIEEPAFDSATCLISAA